MRCPLASASASVSVEPTGLATWALLPSGEVTTQNERVCVMVHVFMVLVYLSVRSKVKAVGVGLHGIHDGHDVVPMGVARRELGGSQGEQADETEYQHCGERQSDDDECCDDVHD